MDKLSFKYIYIKAIQNYLLQKYENNQYFTLYLDDEFLKFKYNQGKNTIHLLVGIQDNGDIIICSEYYNKFDSKNSNEIKKDIYYDLKIKHTFYNVPFDIKFNDWDDYINNYLYKEIKSLKINNYKDYFKLLKIVKE